MKIAARLCTAALLAPACADQSTSPSTTGAGVEVTLAALSLSNVTYTQYTITVKNSSNVVVSTASIDSTSYAVGSDATQVRYVAPCDATASPSANPNTVTVSVDAINIGGVPLVASALPPDQTQSVACVADTSTQVDFAFYALAPAQLGFFDIFIGTNVVYCSAKLDCTAGANFFAGSAAEAVLGFACTADNTATANTVLHMDSIVLACTAGTVGTATIVPGATGNLASGITDTNSFINGVTVFRGQDVVGTTADNVYWNVAIGLNANAIASAADCTLKTHATVTSGATVPPDAPYIVWNVAITTAGNGLTCSNHPLFGTGSNAGVDSAWPTTPDPNPETFDNIYSGSPTAFVTAAMYVPGTGFSSLATADDACMTAASGNLAGTFKAWLSDSTTDAKSRFSAESIRLRDNTLVSLGKPDLIDGTLAHAIDLPETGTALSAQPVWTGTLADGTKDADNCTNWGTNSSGVSGTVGTQSATATWTDNGTQTCDTGAHLICIQVP